MTQGKVQKSLQGLVVATVPPRPGAALDALAKVQAAHYFTLVDRHHLPWDDAARIVSGTSLADYLELQLSEDEASRASRITGGAPKEPGPAI